MNHRQAACLLVAALTLLGCDKNDSKSATGARLETASACQRLRPTNAELERDVKFLSDFDATRLAAVSDCDADGMRTVWWFKGNPPQMQQAWLQHVDWGGWILFTKNPDNTIAHYSTISDPKQ